VSIVQRGVGDRREKPVEQGVVEAERLGIGVGQGGAQDVVSHVGAESKGALATPVGGSSCEFGCCTPEATALPDGGWSQNDKGWVLHPLRVEHVSRVNRAAMAAIDKAQAGSPTCALCGQRVNRPDRYGLCSKTTDAHKAWRAEARRGESTR
jgi:hypothetical protein